MKPGTRYVPRTFRDDGMIDAKDVAHYGLPLAQYIHATLDYAQEVLDLRREVEDLTHDLRLVTDAYRAKESGVPNDIEQQLKYAKALLVIERYDGCVAIHEKVDAFLQSRQSAYADLAAARLCVEKGVG